MAIFILFGRFCIDFTFYIFMEGEVNTNSHGSKLANKKQLRGKNHRKSEKVN